MKNNNECREEQIYLNVVSEEWFKYYQKIKALSRRIDDQKGIIVNTDYVDLMNVINKLIQLQPVVEDNPSMYDWFIKFTIDVYRYVCWLKDQIVLDPYYLGSHVDMELTALLTLKEILEEIENKHL